MEPVDINIAGITIMEPPTAFTDLIVATVCLIAYIKMSRSLKKDQLYERQFMRFFAFMGLCTFFGAIMTHAFPYVFHNEPILRPDQYSQLPWSQRLICNYHNLPNWICNIISVTYFAYASVNRANTILNNKGIKAIRIAIAIESIAVLAATLYKFTFLFAEIHIGVALLIFSAPLQIRVWKYHKRKDAPFILLATFITLFVPMVLIGKMQFSPWFNHNDISHILIASAMTAFYFAAVRWAQEYDTNLDASKIKNVIK